MTARTVGALLCATAALFPFSIKARQAAAPSENTPRVVADRVAVAVGRMKPEQMLRLTLVLEPRRRGELEQLLQSLQDPASPSFHQFLSFAEWKARFAPDERAVAQVMAWARRNGLSVIHRFGNNLALKVEGNALSVEQAFNVQLNHYQLGNRSFFSNDHDPVIPAELFGVLKNVHGLNDFVRLRPAGRSTPAAERQRPIYTPGPFIREESAQSEAPGTALSAAGGLTPQICCGSGGNIEAPDLFSSEGYNLGAFQRFSRCCNPTHEPDGSPRETSIAIIGLDSFALSDLQAFTARYGMAYNVTQVMIDDPSCCDSEVTLDVEMATAMANSFGAGVDTAHVYVYEGGGRNTSDGLDAWEAAHSGDRARVASTSFGTYEDAYGGLGNPSISDFTDIINAMAASGWTMVVASGDHGATEDCEDLSVVFPASSPNVVAAGGTKLTMANVSGSATYVSESAWNGRGCGGTSPPGQNLGGGGGGCSNNQPMVYWQDMVATGCGDKRALPDISLNAASGESWFYGHDGGWALNGGTSIVAPQLAGFFAQANSYLLSLGNVCGPPPHTQRCAPFGNPNPAMWVMGWAGTSPNGHAPFYDISDGTCNGGQGQTGYCTGPGFDLATGWGSVNMLQLGWGLIGVVTHGAVPEVSFSGSPAPGWYNADKRVDFTVFAPSPQGTSASVGVAGYTAQWDSPVADTRSRPTPGSGDSYYDGPVQTGSAGFLTVASVGTGCHTAHVQGWDNSGRTTADRPYGPICYDNLPPTVRCTPPDGQWHATDVALLCTAVDQPALSGLANPSDSAFILSTSVAPGTETADAVTNQREVCDVAGNCVMAGPVGGNKVDKKPPAIAIGSPTTTDYALNQPVVASYTCSDGGSGVAACAGPVASGAAIDTASAGSKTFLVTALDGVANAASASVGYRVTYRVCLQYDPATPLSGRAVEIRLQLCDYNNVNVSSAAVRVIATAVDGVAARAIPLGSLNPGNTFLYGPGTAPGASYLYVLDARGLGQGSHTLSFTVQGDPVVHAAPFTLRK